MKAAPGPCTAAPWINMKVTERLRSGEQAGGGGSNTVSDIQDLWTVEPTTFNLSCPVGLRHTHTYIHSIAFVIFEIDELLLSAE